MSDLIAEQIPSNKVSPGKQVGAHQPYKYTFKARLARQNTQALSSAPLLKPLRPTCQSYKKEKSKSKWMGRLEGEFYVGLLGEGGSEGGVDGFDGYSWVCSTFKHRKENQKLQMRPRHSAETVSFSPGRPQPDRRAQFQAGQKFQNGIKRQTSIQNP